ncbi:VOC family protein [Oceanospirillum beijerinckii]|uniref:VOC family protein n=1 Tax=Oceanospirillum beijerinckii TaxID=64976 RepID=UPI00041F2C02|nr:VOC family protein [Oceanospirillum beijerinckii]
MTTTMLNPQVIRSFDHVGIRVSDRQRSVEFYQRLGFRETAVFPAYEANEMEVGGVRINLIFNGARMDHNPLLDAPVKPPGVTHPAFVVDDLTALQEWLETEGITITQGPHPIGSRRITLFIRDPDGNVLEFNQLISNTPSLTS